MEERVELLDYYKVQYEKLLYHNQELQNTVETLRRQIEQLEKQIEPKALETIKGQSKIIDELYIDLAVLRRLSLLIIEELERQYPDNEVIKLLAKNIYNRVSWQEDEDYDR
ncbi:MAG: hypothetical protein DDT23_00044 [candidate division WS2 bacterium]|nr:hypothetical protein [Candidatus Lithacetigena glycinireducens]